MKKFDILIMKILAIGLILLMTTLVSGGTVQNLNNNSFNSGSNYWTYDDITFSSGNAQHSGTDGWIEQGGFDVDVEDVYYIRIDWQSSVCAGDPGCPTDIKIKVYYQGGTSDLFDSSSEFNYYGCDFFDPSDCYASLLEDDLDAGKDIVKLKFTIYGDDDGYIESVSFVSETSGGGGPF